MFLIRFRCFFSVLLMLLVGVIYGQSSNVNNEAVINIIGDPVQSNNDYNSSNGPTTDSQLQTSTNQTIEPTLENGFHMRYELSSPKAVQHFSSSDPYAGTFNEKTKKSNNNLSKTSFNIKKRFRSMLPERKKRYHPHACGRF